MAKYINHDRQDGIHLLEVASRDKIWFGCIPAEFVLALDKKNDQLLQPLDLLSDQLLKVQLRDALVQQKDQLVNALGLLRGSSSPTTSFVLPPEPKVSNEELQKQINLLEQMQTVPVQKRLL